MGPESTRRLVAPELGPARSILAEPLSAPKPANSAALAAAVPRLPASPAKHPGDVPAIMVDCLEPAPGFRVEIEDAYRAYVAMCAARAVPSLAPETFLARLSEFCRGCQIQTEPEGGQVYLVSVRLLAVPDWEPAPKSRRRTQRSLPLTSPRARTPRLGRAADPRTP